LTSGVNLTIADLAWYWWEDAPPADDNERAWYVLHLDDAPAFESLREEGALQSYQKRIARISDFIRG